MTNAIEVRALRKTFGRTTALDGLDLAVRSGEVHAFLGPNGAGKTTTIRILLGLLRKDGGEASLLGGDPWRDATTLHARLAYVPGDVTLWPGLTGGEIIDLLGSLRGSRSGLDPKRRQDLIERFALDPAKKARAYSKGNRQKVALIAALASDAELLILDEPTAGLDPLMEAVFRECVDDERQRGRTVLLSSHILAEAEALADRVTIIRDGRTAETGTLAEMRHLTRTTVDAELAGPVVLDGLPGVHAAEVRGTHLRCEVDPRRPERRADQADRRRGGGPHLPAADAGGAVPAALFGRTGRAGGPAMTVCPGRDSASRHGRPGQARLPPGPDHAARLGVRDHRGDRQQLLQPEQAVPHGRGPGRPGGQRRPQPGAGVPVRPAVGRLPRRGERLAVRGVGGHLRRADEHLPRGQAHQGRRGGGPARAGRLGRGGPAGRADGRPCWSRWRPTWCWPCCWSSCWSCWACRSRARSPSRWPSRPAGWPSRRSPRWPRSSPRAPGRPAASPSACSAPPTCCGRSATRPGPAGSRG